MKDFRSVRLIGWLLIAAFVLPVPAVVADEGAAWRVVWAHPVLSLLRGEASVSVSALYAIPLVLGVLLVAFAWRRPWLAALLAAPPWLLLPFAHKTGMTLLLTAQQHSFFWVAVAFSLLWVGSSEPGGKRLDRVIHYASLGGALLMVAWLFAPGFNLATPHTPMIRLPFMLIRAEAPYERILGLGLLLASVSWIVATLQCAVEWLGVKIFSRRDRRQILLLSMVFVFAGVFFCELTAMVLRANESAVAQGWVLVGLAFSRLKTYLALAPMFALLPVSCDNWIASRRNADFD